MKGLTSLFLGLFATFAFSWVGMALIPNIQFGHLDPQSDEEGTDIYPRPTSGMVERGRKIYTANGCYYCHTQQVRPAYDSSDIERKWGDRRSAPRDYIFARPVDLGRERLGPDLSNIGKRAPAEDQTGAAPAGGGTAAAAPAASAAPGASAAPAASAASASPAAAKGTTATAAASPAAAANANATATASPPPPGSSQATSKDTNPTDGKPPRYSAAWHHQHLYAPRSVNLDSTMPSFRFLYEKRRISGERSADALPMAGADAPPDGFEVVPSYDAQCLVAYLMALDQSHPLKEVKSSAPASPPAPAPGQAAAKK